MDPVPQDGLVAIVKRDCPTCVLTAPVLGQLAERAGLTVYTQDDPDFPQTVPSREADLDLGVSHRLGIEIVPTLIRFENGREAARAVGWDRAEWERLTGISGLGSGLPEWQPGCGAKNIDPGIIERLKIRFNETGLKSRRIEIGDDDVCRPRCHRQRPDPPPDRHEREGQRTRSRTAPTPNCASWPTIISMRSCGCW